MVARAVLRTPMRRADDLIRMRVPESRVSPPQASPAPPPGPRERLQAALLQRMLEAQQEQAEQLAREAQGKGTVLDIRV
jgi:hypothetical protein